MDTEKAKLVSQILALQQRISVLESEKRDLELLQEITINHSDRIEAELLQTTKLLKQEIELRQQKEVALLQSEYMLRSLVEVLQRDKQDLENLLESATKHGDIISDLLYTENLDARAEQQKLFSTLAEAIPIGVILVRCNDRHIIYANHALGEILAEPASQLIGRDLLSLFYDEIGAKQLIMTGLAQGYVANQELYAQCTNGKRLWLNVSLRMIKLNQQDNFLIACQDITAKKHTEMELKSAKIAAEQANQAKNTFMSNMSHELRTPLNAIINYADILQEEAELTGNLELSQDLEKISQAGKRLLTIVNNILDMCRLEAGDVTIDSAPFDLCQFIAEISQNIQPQCLQAGNQFFVEIKTEIETIVTDRAKLRQCLVNLLSNANKFTPRGTVKLVVETDADYIYFRVVDTGIGIDPANLSKLFQPFVQIDDSTRRKYEGTGLGLAITKKYCQLLGGDVTVTSERGKGSQFTILLPLLTHA
ncbi:MAG: PAS domain-containing sensor histidine kinase [Pseudanabaenaceae cyanobacterium SKYGB_i_bin29]|nr:PAS domain-containing sensor histidine kinase [Pseudanabaenaceae cyanobacterium SKYG29]MDW8422418.1 PAS domain-containing sensor histidine kinase [Pseudanabaenaceae cyanobacterium SKYGB_i_bin29]